MAGTTNSNLINQAQTSTGSSATTTPTPVNDITQIPPGAQMYGSGGTTTYSPQKGGNGRLVTTTGASSTTDPLVQTTVDAWLNAFYTTISSNPTLLQQFSTESQLAGLTGANANIAQLYSAWQKLIVQAYNHNINGQDITPWDVLANSIPGVNVGTYKNNSGYDAMTTMTAAQAASIAAKSAATNKSTTTSANEIDINYTDPDTARYVLNQASQTLLGREATNSEVASFTKNLNNDEANFPKETQDTKTTQGVSGTTTSVGTPASISETGGQGQTVVGYDSAGNPIYGPTGTTTTASSNANTTDTVVSLGEQDYTRYGREQLAEDAAKSAPDYGAYQAAGPLMQAFLGTLKGAVSGVGSNNG
jgi:hypothetical protein